jgi:glycosyltransferase involved in cell wall biosynthesis
MKFRAHKPSICIALPGINYLPYSPYVLSTVPVVPYLAKDYDITVVYRKTLQSEGLDYNYFTLIDQSKMSAREKQNQLGYYSPTNYVELVKYQRLFSQFAKNHAQEFDLVMEKEWPFLGSFSQAFQQHDVPTVLLAEAIYKFQKKSQPLWQGNLIKKALGIGLDSLRPEWRKEWTRKATAVVAETQQLKDFLIEHRYVANKTPIYPIPYGVNLEVFYPRDRQLCRQQLGINQDVFVITYIGSLNRFIQEPGPIIEALGREQPKNVVLHIVGDGNKRHELEAIATQFNSPVIFHGRLPQSQAAVYIGASNLCIAPYNKTLYEDDKFTCASLKIPEYLACGRPALTIPCERMEHLLDTDKYGFLVENNVDSYREFFQNLPTKNDLENKETRIFSDLYNAILKEKHIVFSWQDIAELHKQVIEDCLNRRINRSLSPRNREIITL